MACSKNLKINNDSLPSNLSCKIYIPLTKGIYNNYLCHLLFHSF